MAKYFYKIWNVNGGVCLTLKPLSKFVIGNLHFENANKQFLSEIIILSVFDAHALINALFSDEIDLKPETDVILVMIHLPFVPFS